jgi:putative glutamine amidotransferase
MNIIGINMSPAEKNRKQTIGTSYIQALYEANAIPLPVPAIPDEGFLQKYISRINGFLFTGGSDYPPHLYGQKIQPKTKTMDKQRWQTDILLAKLILSTNKPVLGICAGIQLIALTCGGKLIQHIPTADNHFTREKNKDAYHMVNIRENSILEKIFRAGVIRVNSSHHQAVNPEFPGKNMEITAMSENDRVVEAIEYRGKNFLLGLQWHPERIDDESHRRKIFNAFVQAGK